MCYDTKTLDNCVSEALANTWETNKRHISSEVLKLQDTVFRVGYGMFPGPNGFVLIPAYYSQFNVCDNANGVPGFLFIVVEIREVYC
jgi:hypothetical protein